MTTSLQLQRTSAGNVSDNLQVIYGTNTHTHSVAQFDEMLEAPAASTHQGSKFKHLHDTLINRQSLVTGTATSPSKFYKTAQEGTVFDDGVTHIAFRAYMALLEQQMAVIATEIGSYLNDNMTTAEQTTNDLSTVPNVEGFLGASPQTPGLFKIGGNGNVSSINDDIWQTLSQTLREAVPDIVRLWSGYTSTKSYLGKDWLGTQTSPTASEHWKNTESNSMAWWGNKVRKYITESVDTVRPAETLQIRDSTNTALPPGVVLPANADIFINPALATMKSAMESLTTDVGEVTNQLNYRYYRKDERYHFAFKIEKRTGKIKFMDYEFVNTTHTGYNDPMAWFDADPVNKGKDFLKGLDLQARERALHAGHEHTDVSDANLFTMARDFAAAFILENQDTYGDSTIGGASQETFHKILMANWDDTNATEYNIAPEHVTHDLHFQVHSIVNASFTEPLATAMDTYINGSDFDRTIADHWYELANQRDSEGAAITDTTVLAGMPTDAQLDICASVISRGTDQYTYDANGWSEIFVFRGRGDDEHRWSPTYTFNVQLYDHAMVDAVAPAFVHQEERVEVQHIEMEFIPTEHLQVEYQSYVCMMHIPESFTDWNTLQDVNSVFYVHLIKKNNEIKLYAFSKLEDALLTNNTLDERFKYYDTRNYLTNERASSATDSRDHAYEALPGSNQKLSSRRVINDFIGEHFQRQYGTNTPDKLFLYKCEMDQSFTLMTYGDATVDTEKLLRFTGMCLP